jgi:hypothetical protein
MKKILSIFIAVLVLLSCFSFSAFADVVTPGWKPAGESNYANIDADSIIRISEDYKKLYLDEKVYSRFSKDISLYCGYDVSNTPALTDAQLEEIEDVNLYASENGEMFEVSIYYKDGAEFIATYLLDEYIEEYNKLIATESKKYYIIYQTYEYTDDYETEEIVVEATADKLKSDKFDLEVNEFLYNGETDVCVKSEKYDFYITSGSLLEYDGGYVYVDFNDTKLTEDDFFVYDYKGPAYKVTDPALVQKIEESTDRYYEKMDYGFFFDDDFSKTVSNVFLITICAVIPFAIFVLAVIFSFRAKKIYKKLFITIASLSIAEVILFLILAFFIK